MMKATRAVLFDLDGTLLDTLDDMTASSNWALAQVGRPAKTREQIRGFVGNGVRLLCERLVAPERDEALIEHVFNVFRTYYSAHMAVMTQPYPGIMALLEEVRRRGIARGVISNKYDAATKEICRKYFGNLVDVAVGEGNGVAKKPCPDGALHAMRALKATQSETIYVGDSDVDVETAHNAGLFCVGVTWGFRDREVLLRAGADALIEKPEELLAMLPDSVPPKR